jgi:predicted transcriptional regulator
MTTTGAGPTRPRRNGRPRGDAALLEVFTDAGWLSLREVIERTGKSYWATQQALYRGRRRGVIEHQAGRGYRAMGAPPP